MASNSLCAACRQVVRLRFRQFGRSTEFCVARTASSTRSIPRLFSTSRLLSAAPPTPKESQPSPREYQPKPPPATSEAGKDPQAAASEEKKSGAPSTEPTSIAKEIHKRFSSVTETYVAYGVCEKLVIECARQADYTIPQAREKNVEIPKTKDKEDLGIGTGWWFDSEQISLRCGNRRL